MKYVIKRDGTKQKFNRVKIISAILKANKEADKEYGNVAVDVANRIAKEIEKIDEDLTIEEIQTLVKRKLMSSKLKETAIKYISYAHDREQIRISKSKLMSDIAEKLLATNVQNQNANVDEKSFGGRKGEADSVVMKEYALNNCMSEMAKYNHLNNIVYQHDLDSFAIGMHNCLSIPFDHLLEDGFITKQVDIRPANSINTALQLVAVIFQLQSLQQFGGCSATHLDWTLAPYVRKSFIKHFQDGLKYIENLSDYKVNRFKKWFLHLEDQSITNDELINKHPKAYQYAMDMTEKELNQAVEGMYHNLNY